MTTCNVCDDDLTELGSLECPDCKETFCKQHYHGHDCEPVGEKESEVKRESTIGSSESADLIDYSASFGYVFGILVGLMGLLYLFGGIDLIISGGAGVEAWQDFIELLIAGSLFSFATFVLVLSYIIDQS